MACQPGSVCRDRHAATLLGYLTRRVGQSSAEDLLGELFRIAFESPHRYDLTRPNARPWLYGIAANLFWSTFARTSEATRPCVVSYTRTVPPTYPSMIASSRTWSTPSGLVGSPIWSSGSRRTTERRSCSTRRST
ncbi:MAG: hypothetical protein IPF88_02800 [Candidatus Microthrix sp.]|nr:hypothetical protein [Candidatus Microthrix sp.]